MADNTISQAWPMQDGTNFGESDLYRMLTDFLVEGVVNTAADFVITQNGGGDNTVNCAGGSAYVNVDTPFGGTRRVFKSASSNSGSPGAPNTPGWESTFTTRDATNPRVDRVVLTVYDNAVDASGKNKAVLRVIAGTPTAGATLVNLNGIAAMPVNSILVAYVLMVPSSVRNTILTADINNAVKQKATIGLSNTGITTNAPVVGQVPVWTAGAGSVPTGWQSGPGTALSLICDSGTVASQATFDTNTLLGGNIPATFKHLRLALVARTDSTTGQLRVQFNGDVGTNYRRLYSPSGAAITAQETYWSAGANNPFCHSSNAADIAGVFEATIFDYAQATYRKRMLGVVESAYDAVNLFSSSIAGTWNSTAAINQIVVSLSAGNFTEARFSLYGIG